MPVEPVGDLVQALLQVAEQQVILLQRVALPTLDHAGQHVEALFQLLHQPVGVGHGRRAVDAVGDQLDLAAEPLDRLLGQVGAGGQFVDAARQKVEMVQHALGRPLLRHFLDLAGKLGDALLDAFERGGIEGGGLCRHRGGDDGARYFVQPLVDLDEGVAGPAALLVGEVVHGACQRAHLLLQRAQRKRFWQVVDGLADLLEPLGESGQRRVARAAPGVSVETAFEGAPAAVHRAHALLARQRIERGTHLLQFEAQQVHASVVALFGKLLNGAGKPLELHAERRALTRRGRGPGRALDVAAQHLELAMQTGGHLLAQFLAQAAQLAGDFAGHGDAVLLAAQALDVAGERLVALVEGRGAGRARPGKRFARRIGGLALRARRLEAPLLAIGVGAGVARFGFGAGIP